MVLLHQIGVAGNILDGQNVQIRAAGQLGAEHGHVVGGAQIHIFDGHIGMGFFVGFNQRLVVGGCFPVPQGPL
ncbi:hypothetical protein D3C75_1300670 [compost metagenome]